MLRFRFAKFREPDLRSGSGSAPELDQTGPWQPYADELILRRHVFASSRDEADHHDEHSGMENVHTTPLKPLVQRLFPPMHHHPYLGAI